MLPRTSLRFVTTALVGGVAALIVAASLPAFGQGKILRIGLNQDPDILDPTLGRTYVGTLVFTSICEGLYTLDEKGTPVPQLAVGMPKVFDGGKTAEIRLRTGVKFNDGTPFDAEAMKASLERHQTMKGSNRRSELALLTGIEVVDAHTLRLKLQRPFAPLAATLADRAGMAVSPTQVAKLGEKFGTDPVCVGPWKFVERVAQDRIVLEKSPYYYDPSAAQIDQIIYRIIPDDSVRLANLRSGDLDFVQAVPATDIKGLEQEPGISVVEVPGLGYQGITVNLANKTGKTNPPQPLDTPLASSEKVREALDVSIDRDVLNQVAFDGRYTADCAPLPPFTIYYPKGMVCPKQDIPKAKKLLADAGFPGGFKFNLMVVNNPVQMRVAQILQGMVAEAGITMTIQPMEFATSLAQSDSGMYDAFLIGWSGLGDPDGNIHQMQTCKGSLNVTLACTPEIDTLLDRARESNDMKERQALYRQAITKFTGRRNIIYLYHLTYTVAFKKGIKGFVATPDGYIRLKGVKMS
jgi:peptide/nickel transport system substrate-binding protein